MDFNKLFPLKFCINLDHRADRWALAQGEFAKHDLSVSRFSGIMWNGTNNKTWNGYVGCDKSHLEILKLAEKENENVFIFEDDVTFINDFSILNEVELPEWDMFYLGANIGNSIYQVSDHLGRLTHAQATHAYGINKNFLSKLIYSLESVVEKSLMDLLYANTIVPDNNCFIAIPMLAVQRSDFSNTENKFTDRNWMEQRFYDQLIRK